MIPPVQVSPLIKFTRYSALLMGMIYGKKRYDYLKPIAEEERRVEAEEKKKREELERIAKELAEGNRAHYPSSAAALCAPKVPSHGLQALCVHRPVARARKGSPSCPCV